VFALAMLATLLPHLVLLVRLAVPLTLTRYLLLFNSEVVVSTLWFVGLTFVSAHGLMNLFLISFQPILKPSLSEFSFCLVGRQR
jgi:hypothetical protein